MANDIKLQEGHPVDENLRPIKVGGKSTALETAQHGNGAKVNGDLTVTGKIKGKTDIQLTDDITCDDITMAGDITSTNLTIDDSGDITLDADGGDIFLKDGGNKFAQFSTLVGFPLLRMYESPGGTDYFQINTLTNGVTLISTVDIDGSSGDLSLDIDGDITLNSRTGVFIAENDGDEFSVANSAYAGMIIGYTTVGIDATAGSHTLQNATMTVTDSDHNVSFIAPPSGVVEIFVSIYGDFARRNPVFGLSDNATYAAIDFPNANDPTNEHVLRVPPSSGGDTMLRNYWVVTGLTAGDTYKWWLGAKTAAGAGGVLRWGGTATDSYPPFIMKATALPAAVTDFAVYG